MMGETFVGEFFRWVAKFFPRPFICRSTHGGVKFCAGKTKEIKPGFHWYWPLFTEIEMIPVVHHSVDLPSQTLTTKDDIAVTVSPVIVIEVRNVMKALVKTYDCDDTLQEIGGAAIVSCIEKRTFKQLRDGLTSIVWPEFTKQARVLLSKYGVYVINAYTTDYHETTAFRHVGDAGPMVVQSGE